jgi:serine/threonine protein kinase
LVQLSPVDAPVLLNDRYLLVQPLASGGMAHVWRGEDKLLGRTVAVKILREEFTRKPDFQRRFRSEARAVARLSHPNLVTVYDFGVQDERCFIVLEYVEGTDLKTYLRGVRRSSAEPPPDWRAWGAIALQVCEGLGLAHRAGVVHADIKPQNILLRGDRQVKITDFGIARAVAPEGSGPAPAADRSEVCPPAEETVWGSPQYFSPEQAAGEPLTPASDVYSTGVMLFEMLTGRLPFPGRDPRTLALQHLHEPPPSPRLLCPDLPPAMEEIVLRAMAKEPGRRFRNGDQMARILKGTLAPPAARAAAGEGQEAEEDGGIDWKAVALGFLGLIAVGGLFPLWMYVYFLYNPPGR